MSTPSATQPIWKRRFQMCLAFLFMALLWLPTLDTFLHLDHATEISENRFLAKWPQFVPGWSGLKSYATGLDAYFNDHFGFRRQLLHWQLQLQAALGGRSDIVIGKDGYLFFNEPGTHFVENLRGTAPMSPLELAALQRVVESRREWLAQRGARYALVIAPDKQTICPDLLPAWLKPTTGATRLDQLLGYLRTNSEVLMPDLRPALRNARQTMPTYFKSDTHWNSFGGYIASEELGQYLQDEHGSNSAPLSSFEITNIPLERGDLALMLGVYINEDDPKPIPTTKLPDMNMSIKHPEYLKPIVYTTNLNAQGVCLVFEDSFGPALQPYLGYHFRSVGYFWAPGGFDTNIIAMMHPDVVISEIVERHLDVIGK